MVFWEFIKYMFQFLVEAALHIIYFILCWGMNVQNKDISLVTSQYYVQHLVTNKCNPLTADMSYMHVRAGAHIHKTCIYSPFHREMYICLLVWCHPSHLTFWTPTISNLYFDSSFITVISKPALYRLLTFHVRNPMAIFLTLGHLAK
jgi:hypothetical protein